jgi:cytochrome b6-f complex iron-sulfur subunit
VKGGALNDSEKPGPAARRSFLNLAIVGTTAALGTAAGYPAARFLSPIARPTREVVEVGRVDDFAVGTAKPIQLGERAALVIRLPDGSFRAFIALCTHLGCVVGYSSERNRIECRCHAGVYSVEGENISGPPPRPLQALRVNVRDGMVLVGEV